MKIIALNILLMFISTWIFNLNGQQDMNIAMFQSQINTCLNSISIKDGQSIAGDIALAKGENGISIFWNSDAENIIPSGNLTNLRSGKNRTDIRNEGFDAYLFAYFTGNDISEEAIRFAVSKDGFVYTALNNNDPILKSSQISSTGGIRDPHILRGADGKSFYMVATDMVSANGWASNRAMVLLKSEDLINWQSQVINIQNRYNGYEDLQSVWAPQTIYDEKEGKYMVYWSMRIGTNPDKIYYAYANNDFKGFEAAPQILFEDPNGVGSIDADIVYNDGQFHLFYKTEGENYGIKKAVSQSLTGSYTLIDKYLQATSNPVEGGCVFRLYDTDTWLLIYDMYLNGKYQFTESTNLENFTVMEENISFDFTPRHGTIIPITQNELNCLNYKWENIGSCTADSTTTSRKTINESDMDVEPDFIKYYQIDGKEVQRIEDLKTGIYIEQTFYKNGSSKTKKIYR